MRVRLLTELFASEKYDVDLIRVFALAADGRHRVVTDLDAPQVQSWLDRQAPAVRETCEFAIQASLDLEPLEPSALALDVSAEAAPVWTRAPALIPLAQALPLLSRPFGILLEDSDSDRAFLLKYASAEELAFLREFEEKGWLEFIHGGGLSNVEKRVVSWREKGGETCLARWVIFDRDGLQPGICSSQSQRVRDACAGVLKFHQLQRRAIENYLPIGALFSWASVAQGAERKRRRKSAEEFAKMSPAQRSHYNMKGGFARDAKRSDQSAGALYATLSAATLQVLDVGFGNDVASLFKCAFVREDHLRRDGSWSEISPLVRAIVEYAR